MFLFYVYNEGSWEFFDSVKWSDADDVTISVVVENAYSYIGYVNDRYINFAKFLHDMIHYRQFVTNSITIYYIDMPG